MSEIIDLKVFVPSRDFQLSKTFYSDLGFSLNWENDQLAEFQIGQFRFLLQDFFEEQLAANIMLQLQVTDTSIWWNDICEGALVERYEQVRAKEPEIQPWGQRVLYLWDPSGVLWHIAEPLETGA
ncbi:MAG: putative glyoxalase superfamily protein PhnB [Candidatus Azotimanducaceae bacterium]